MSKVMLKVAGCNANNFATAQPHLRGDQTGVRIGDPMEATSNPISNRPTLIGAWDQERVEKYKQSTFAGLTPARIIASSREHYELLANGETYKARIAGKLHHSIYKGESTFPVVGDWVAMLPSYDTAIIQAICERRNYFSRQYSGSANDEQVVAANLDYLFIVMGLDSDFNLNRLDRYLVMARHGGVTPVVVLSKLDLCRDLNLYIARTRYERDDSLKVIAISSKHGHGLGELEQMCTENVSILLVGSSGAGKSSLINYICRGDLARTGSLSEANGRGTATTTMTRGYSTPSGAMMIDAAGMREVQLWADNHDLDAAFEEITEWARHCKFRDCAHQGEPGCALSYALLEGRLTQERFSNYMKLRNEIEGSQEHMLEKKRKRFKQIAKANRSRRKMGYGT